MSVVYDAGVLIAADRNDRAIWAQHRLRLEAGVIPATSAPAAAQASRSPRQVQLRRFLRGCDLVGFIPERAHEVGELLGRAGSSDVVDAHLVIVAARSGSTLLTSDKDDIERLCQALPSQEKPAVHSIL